MTIRAHDCQHKTLLKFGRVYRCALCGAAPNNRITAQRCGICGAFYRRFKGDGDRVICGRCGTEWSSS